MGIDLKTLIQRIKVGERLGEPAPPFYNFMFVDEERNVTMFDKTVTDTAFAGTIKRIWMYFGKNAPPPVKEEIINIYKDLIGKFKARGGNVIFARFPSSGGFREGENMGLPRDQYWQELLFQTACPGYHFEDYTALNQFDPPEWSHLSTPDAKTYTKDFVAILLKDEMITPVK